MQVVAVVPRARSYNEMNWLGDLIRPERACLLWPRHPSNAQELTYRWAIEDPNPGEVRREAARIEQLGKEAIKGMLDEGIVEAAQTIRALEDGDEQDFYPIEESGALPGEEEEDEHADGRAAKRIKSSAQAGDGTAKETLGSGLLSGEAMENLKYYADLARQQAEERKRKVPAAAPPVAVKKAQAKPTSGGLAALGGYASDSD